MQLTINDRQDVDGKAATCVTIVGNNTNCGKSPHRRDNSWIWRWRNAPHSCCKAVQSFTNVLVCWQIERRWQRQSQKCPVSDKSCDKCSPCSQADGCWFPHTSVETRAVCATALSWNKSTLFRLLLPQCAWQNNDKQLWSYMYTRLTSYLDPDGLYEQFH